MSEESAMDVGRGAAGSYRYFPWRFLPSTKSMGVVSEIELPATALSARTNFAFFRLALLVGRWILPTARCASHRRISPRPTRGAAPRLFATGKLRQVVR